LYYQCFDFFLFASNIFTLTLSQMYDCVQQHINYTLYIYTRTAVITSKQSIILHNNQLHLYLLCILSLRGPEFPFFLSISSF